MRIRGNTWGRRGRGWKFFFVVFFNIYHYLSKKNSFFLNFFTMSTGAVFAIFLKIAGKSFFSLVNLIFVVIFGLIGR
jgi:hypothetical protein